MEQTQSENISTLASALVLVQGELEGAKKDATNPFFKADYADLQSVWQCCRSLLTQNGLCVIQTNGGTAEAPSVITTLAHTSGEWIRGELAMIPDKKGPQGTGSAITYARRYALAAIIGIYQVDDDAEGATSRQKKAPPKAKPKPMANKADFDDRPMGIISEDRRKRLHTLATKNKWAVTAVKSLLAKHGFDSSTLVTNDKYKAICDELELGMTGVDPVTGEAIPPE